MIREHYVAIYQSICNAKRMRKLPDDSCRLFYVLLQTHCDSWGRCHADADKLWGETWATFGRTVKDTERALQALHKAELIVLYEVAGERYLAVPDWEDKAGKVGRLERRRDSKFPNPPTRGTSPADAGVVPLTRARGSDPIREDPIRSDPSQDARERALGSPPAEPLSGPEPWAEAFEKHAGMDTPEVRVAVEAWAAHRRAHRYPPWRPPQWTKNLGLFAAHGANGPPRFVAAVEHSSVTNTYQSIQEPKGFALNGRGSAVPTGRDAIARFKSRFQQREIVVEATEATA